MPWKWLKIRPERMARTVLNSKSISMSLILYLYKMDMDVVLMQVNITKWMASLNYSILNFKVGMFDRKGSQPVSLSINGCVHEYIVAHELIHALGN